jgi:hypothetical protein
VPLGALTDKDVILSLLLLHRRIHYCRSMAPEFWGVSQVGWHAVATLTGVATLLTAAIAAAVACRQFRIMGRMSRMPSPVAAERIESRNVLWNSRRKATSA